MIDTDRFTIPVEESVYREIESKGMVNVNRDNKKNPTHHRTT